MTTEQVEKGTFLLKEINKLETKQKDCESMLEYAQFMISTNTTRFKLFLPSEDLKWVVEKEIIRLSKKIDALKDEFIKL